MAKNKGGAILFLALGGSVVALALAIGEGTARATENWLPKGKGKKLTKSLLDAAKALPRDVVASAKKWAAARNLPLIDVLTTILLESRGNPQAHALTDREDSRGLMQVNIRSEGATLQKLGYTPDDLYKVDVGIEVGTLIYAAKRQAVLKLLTQTNRQQTYSPDVLIRMYYAGPKYATAWILNGTHFKDMEVYADHWKAAKDAIAQAMAANAYA